MRRTMWASLVVTLLISSSVVMASSSTVTISSHGRIESQALALNDADINPQGDRILVVGDEGYAIIMNSNSPQQDKQRTILDSGQNNSLNTVGWHVGGKTALIAGDNGVVLRYVESSNTIENINGTGALEGTDIDAIAWRNNGDRAYLGGEAGRIYSYDSENGFQLLDQTADSQITSISCHRHHSICLVTTLQNGIAIIDRDSQVTWHGESSNTWLDSVCSDSDVNECVAIASGRRVSAIILKPDNVDKSIIEPAEIISDLSGEFIHISSLRNNAITINMAPYGIIEYNLEKRTAFQMLDHEDVKGVEIELSGTSLVHVWGTDLSHGFTISSDGTIGEISPILAEESDLMTKAVMVLVSIAVPGTIIGLIFMSSETLQNWYKTWRKNKRLKAREKAKMKRKMKARK